VRIALANVPAFRFRDVPGRDAFQAWITALDSRQGRAGDAVAGLSDADLRPAVERAEWLIPDLKTEMPRLQAELDRAT
jgi:hypothetical protein